MVHVIEYFNKVRRFTEKICEPLLTEDFVIQSMPEVSPPKWHLGHTTWFFENFILNTYCKNYQPDQPQFNFIFNSYYKTVGDHFIRCKRGILSRPSVNEIYRYRRVIDERISELLTSASEAQLQEIVPILILGLNHEQQHQELLVTDIKHIFWVNPLRPTYLSSSKTDKLTFKPQSISFKSGLYEVGYACQGGNKISENQDPFSFSYDNERPRHRVYLEEFAMDSRLVTQGEYLEFIDAGGYQNPALWLSDGWNNVEKNNWAAPLYWEKHDNQWWVFTLSGLRPLNKDEPVCHVSFYEADAYAKWKNKRLPTEFEWEVAASLAQLQGNFMESGLFHPTAASWSPEFPLSQLYGDTWEWTQSAYLPYPGYHPWAGSIGEYNGKFMCNQMTLRGGSCATPIQHIRSTYRNFFTPDTRWQFTGFRLAGTP